MKRPKLRKSSKRMSCSKKYRIKKNVAAHNKKLRREAKKNGGNKHKKKDPGVPNSLPFKEEILREAECRKQRAEEEKLRKKEQRLNEVNKRRSLETFQKDILQRQKSFENKTNTLNKLGHDAVTGSTKEMSRKAYYKEFQKVVDNADVVVEVLDARDPLGCRCLEMEKMILDSGNKRIVLLLNKIDLVPKENVKEWLKYLRSEFPTVAFKASTQTQNILTRCKASLKQINDEVLSNTSQCVGADSLIKLLSNYCRYNDAETSITVGVVGFPNVGKSSVINSLKRTRACNVGSIPGVTKTLQEVTLNKHIKILDCPGIVMATGKSDAAMVLRNCVKVESLDDPISPVEAILSRCNKQQIMLRYNVGDYCDVNEFLDHLARRMGKLQKGGIPNVDAAAKSVLQDWNTGRISYFTHPPLDGANSHIEAKIVDSMNKEFDWDSLEQDNLTALGEVKGCPSQSSSVLYQSSGPAEMEADEDVEEDEDAEEISDMEQDEPHSRELGEITIDITTKSKTKQTAKSPHPKKKITLSTDGMEEIEMRGSNLQTNQMVKELLKRNKKKQKRADKLSDKLGDSLVNAMNFSKSSELEDYDFDSDFKMS